MTDADRLLQRLVSNWHEETGAGIEQAKLAHARHRLSSWLGEERSTELEADVQVEGHRWLLLASSDDEEIELLRFIDDTKRGDSVEIDSVFLGALSDGTCLEHLIVDVPPDEEKLTLTFRHAKVPCGEMVFEAGEDRELVDAVRTVFRLWSR